MRTTTRPARRHVSRTVSALLLGALTIGPLAGASGAAAAGPDYEMPFPCGDA